MPRTSDQNVPDTGADLIELHRVSIRLGTTVAVQDASLTLRRASFMGIVGPSGAGKTTLLKAIAGAVRPTEGTITRRPGLRIGYVPQVDKINWYFPATVIEVVTMATGRKGAARAAQVLEKLGLGELGQRHIRDLSGGQQRRVFIARALVADPTVLLLDEPTAGVDVATRHDVLHLLHDLNHDEGIAVVITTHDLNGIAAHMHDLVCLNRTVIAAGPAAEILTPEVLERTYGAPMSVLSHGGMPVIVEHFETADQVSRIGEAHHEH